MTKKILILGATGMLGHTLICELAARSEYSLHTTTRSCDGLERWFPSALLDRFHSSVDTDNFDSVLRVLVEVCPDVVINYISGIKQLSQLMYRRHDQNWWQ